MWMARKSLNETHAISDEIIHRIEALPEVDRAYVHIEPEGYDRGILLRHIEEDQQKRTIRST
jgi:divalent metal cation (Fe/Co/Zn/Cd) transporter